MYCRKCGAELEDDCRFCTKCGETIEETTGKTEEKDVSILAFIKKYPEKIVGTFGALLVIAGVFMNFVFINFIGKIGLKLIDKPDGKIILATAILSLVMVLVNFAPIFGSVVAVATAGLVVVEIVLFKDNLNSMSSGGGLISDMSQLLSYGAGYYLLIIGSVILLLGQIAHASKLIKSGVHPLGSVTVWKYISSKQGK